MVSINYAFKEIISKIVYYGPGLSGKTSNLQYVFKQVPSETRGELISLATDADRTLYFDFLPVNVGTIQGFSTKFQLYTVPGQVYYNATRKLVLRGVDGLVFVADSQTAKMDENLESLTNLRDNLTEYGYDIDQIPMVIQYNKRDLSNIATLEELERILNPRGVPYFEAVATTGDGVFKTLKAISKMVLDQVKAKRMEPGRVAKPQPAAVTVGEPASASRYNETKIAKEAPIPDLERTQLAQANGDTHTIEIPTEPDRVSRKSTSDDRVGTRSITPAAIVDIETRTNVVVSDAVDEEDEEGTPGLSESIEDTTENTVLDDSLREVDLRHSEETDDIALANDYGQVEEEKHSKTKSKYILEDDYNSSQAENVVVVPQIDLRTPMALRRPQMAESRKVKGRRRRFTFFGLFKKRE